jgi:hypothetical protein
MKNQPSKRASFACTVRIQRSLSSCTRPASAPAAPQV